MFVDRSGCSRHQGRKGLFLKDNNVIREKKQSSKCTTWCRVKKKMWSLWERTNISGPAFLNSLCASQELYSVHQALLSITKSNQIPLIVVNIKKLTQSLTIDLRYLDMVSLANITGYRIVSSVIVYFEKYNISNTACEAVTQEHTDFSVISGCQYVVNRGTMATMTWCVEHGTESTLEKYDLSTCFGIQEQLNIYHSDLTVSICRDQFWKACANRSYRMLTLQDTCCNDTQWCGMISAPECRHLGRRCRQLT